MRCLLFLIVPPNQNVDKQTIWQTYLNEGIELLVLEPGRKVITLDDVDAEALPVWQVLHRELDLSQLSYTLVVKHLSTTTQNTQNLNSAAPSRCVLNLTFYNLKVPNRTQYMGSYLRQLQMHKTSYLWQLQVLETSDPRDGFLPVTAPGAGDLTPNRWVLTCDSCRCWRPHIQQMGSYLWQLQVMETWDPTDGSYL